MKQVIFAFVVLTSPACAGSFRSFGMQDPTVESVRALAQVQVETIKALTAALTKAQASACEVIR